MKKKMIPLIIGCFMVASLPQTALAQTSGINGSGQSPNRAPEDMTAAEIIDELYANEVNPDIYQCARSSAMILTGEKQAVDYYGTILIGTYDSPDVYYHANISVPVGNTAVQASIEHAYTMVLPFSSAPTPETSATNKEALNQLYRTVQEAKQETQGLPDSGKAAYLVAFVQERLDKQAPVIGRTATCLQNGYADCDGFAGLYYIMAMNCGLHVKTVLGTCLNEDHAWNMVQIDGVWSVVDPILNVIFLPEAEMSQRGYRPIY